MLSLKSLKRHRQKIKKLAPFALGIALVLIPLIFISLRNRFKAQAEWLTGEWIYRQVVSVTNASGGELTDYQTYVVLDTKTPIAAHKMQTDCRDVRFTTSNNVIIPYWIEDGCNTTATKFWVKVPSIPTTGTTLYVYYGNVYVTAASSGTNTFIFFDDFDDGDSSGWETHNRSYNYGSPTLSYAETGGQQKISGTTGLASDYGGGLRTGTSYPTPITFDIQRVAFSATGTRAFGDAMMYQDDNNWVAYGGGMQYNAVANKVQRLSRIASSRSTDEAIGTYSDDYGSHRLTIKQSGTAASFFFDETSVVSQTVTMSAVKVGTTSWLRNATDSIDARFDNARLRKYSATEPVATVKTYEEKYSGAPIALWAFDEGYSANEAHTEKKLEQQINILTHAFNCRACTNQPTDNSLGIIKWDANKFSNSTVYFETVMKTGGGATVSATLYTTAGVALDSSTITSGAWDTTYTRFRSGAITLTDGEQYTVRFTSANGAVENSAIAVARLVIVQNTDTGLNSTQTNIEIGGSEMQTLSSYTSLAFPKIYYYDQTKFSPRPTSYFEASLKSGDQPTIEQQINLLNTTATTTGSTYPAITSKYGVFHWDSSKYPGATLYLDATCQTTGWVSRVSLFTTGGTQVAASVAQSATSNLERLRSAAFTAADLTDNTDYTIEVSNSSIYVTTCNDVHLTIVQSNATSINATSTHIELGSYLAGFTNTSNAPFSSPKYYMYDQNKFTPTAEASGDISFAATLQIADSADTVYATLINKTHGTTVAEVSRTGATTWGLSTVTNIDADADWDTTNDDDYEVQVRCADGNGGGCSGSISNAHIIIDQASGSGITALEMVQSQVSKLSSSATSAWVAQNQYTYSNPDLFNDYAVSFGSARLKYFYEADMKTGGGTGYAQLYTITHASNASPKYYDNSTSQIATTSTSFQRVRSSDITSVFTWPPIYTPFVTDTGLKNSGTWPTSVSNSALIVQVSNLSTTGLPTAYAELYNVTDNVSVTGSEVSTNSTDWTRLRSNPVTLTTGKEYIVRIRSSTNGAPIYIANAKIIQDQASTSGLYSTEVVQDMINDNQTNTNDVYATISRPQSYTLSNFDYIESFNEYPIYFEANMKTTSGTGYAQAYSGSAITGSEVTTTKTNGYERQRSGAIDGNMPITATDVNTQLRHSSTAPNSTLVSSSKLIIQNQKVIQNITHDSTDSGYHASVTGPTWQASQDCANSFCLKFDGVNDYVKVAAQTVPGFDQNDSFSITAWFKTGQKTGTIVSNYLATTGTDGGYKIYLSDGMVVAGIDDDNSWGPDDSVVSTKLYDDNAWHQVIMVKNATSNLKLYIDGALVATDSSLTATGTLANTDPTYFGIDGDGTSNPFNGSLDTVSIFPRALSTEDINKSYSAQSAVKIGTSDIGKFSSDLVLNWKFDETTANTCDGTNDACDSSGNGINGAWNGNVAATNGKFGSSADFDGTGDYVSATNTSNIKGESSWYNIDWKRRKSFSILSGNTAPLTNYTIQLTIPYDTDMKSDFSDIRFIKDDHTTALPYWIESKTDSSTATVWVKIDSIPTAGMTLYMYYSNINANSESSGTNTFQFFDDFNSDPGYTQLSAGAGTGNYTVDASLVTVTETLSTGSGLDYGIQIGTGFTTTGSQQVRASFNPIVSKEIHGIYFCGNVSGYNSSTRMYRFAGSQSWGYAADQLYSGTGLQTVYANMEDFRCTGNISLMEDDDATDSASSVYDYVLIRKYSATEPTYTSLPEDALEDVLNPQITVSAWVNPDTLDATQRIIAVRGSAPSYDWMLAFSASSPGKILFANGNGLNQKVSTNTLTTGTWNQVVMVIDGITAKLFINGNYDSEISTVGTSFLRYPISVGATTTGAQGYDGKIDDFRVYTKALDVTEVKQLYSWEPGPVGYWKLENDSTTSVYDSTGNNPTGTFSGSTSDHYGTGVLGKAAYFNGVDDRIMVPYNVNNRFGDTDGTITAWIKTPSDIFQILGKHGSDYNDTLQVSLSSGVLTFRAQDLSWAGFNMCFGGPPLNDNVWHHIAISLNKSTATAKIYIDGINVSTNGCTGTAFSTFAPDYDLYIGNTDSTDYGEGYIDDVKMYNYERTPSQILQDMNGGHPIPGSPIGSAVVNWKLDEGTGDTGNNSGNASPDYNLDLAGSGTDCPQTGDSACPTWSNNGKFGKALNFSTAGTTDAYATTNFTDFGSEGTISFWMNPSANSNSYYVFDGSSSTNRWLFYRNKDYPATAWGLWLGGSEIVDGANGCNLDPYITTGSWHNVAITYNSTSSMVKFYVDTELRCTKNIGFTTGQPDGLVLGARYSLSENYNGLLDDFKIYTAELTPAQIGQIYNNSSAVAFSSVSTNAGGTAPDFSSAREYCIPGDTSTCNSPIGEWKLDENQGSTAHDTSGNNNDLVTYGTPVWDSGKNGSGMKIGNTGWNFESSNTTPALTDMDTWTISAWAYPTELNNGTYYTVISNNRYGSTMNYYIQAVGTELEGGFFADGSWRRVTTSGLNLQLNKWYYFTFTFDITTHDAVLYVNGQHVQTTNLNYTPDVSDGFENFEIGNDGGWNEYWRGKIDQVTVYDYVRTPAQIAWDYNQGKPIVHYKFDECTGTTAYNSALNGNGEAAGINGTITIGGSGTQDTTGSCKSEDTGDAWNNGTTGKYGASMSFDGSDDYAYTATTVDLSTTDKITVAFWLNWDNYDVNDALALESSTNFNENAGAILVDPNDTTCGTNSLSISIHDVSYKFNCYNRPSTGTWHHWAIIFDHSTTEGEITFYLDGIKQTPTATPMVGTNTGHFGNFTWYLMSRAGSSLLGKGLMDDFRIYNYPLTETQIRNVYNGGYGVTFLRN